MVAVGSLLVISGGEGIVAVDTLLKNAKDTFMTALLYQLMTWLAPCPVPQNLIDDIPSIAEEVFVGFRPHYSHIGCIGVDTDWTYRIFPNNFKNAIQSRYGVDNYYDWLYGNPDGKVYGTMPTNLQLQYYPNWPDCDTGGEDDGNM